MNLQEGLPQRLRQVCEGRGMTTTEAAKAAGVSRMTWSSWQNGHSEPRPAALMGLARKTEVNLKWLADGDRTYLPDFLVPKPVEWAIPVDIAPAASEPAIAWSDIPFGG